MDLGFGPDFGFGIFRLDSGFEGNLGSGVSSELGDFGL